MGRVDRLIEPGRGAWIQGQRMRIQQAHHERTDRQTRLAHLVLVPLADRRVRDLETIRPCPDADLDTVEPSLAGLFEVDDASPETDRIGGGAARGGLRLDSREERPAGQHCCSLAEERPPIEGRVMRGHVIGGSLHMSQSDVALTIPHFSSRRPQAVSPDEY